MNTIFSPMNAPWHSYQNRTCCPGTRWPLHISLSSVCVSVCVCIYLEPWVCFFLMRLRTHVSHVWCQSPTLFLSSSFSPIIPPLHLCITSTILSLLTLTCFIFFFLSSLPSHLSLTYSAPPGMTEHWNAHTHTHTPPQQSWEREMKAMCRWTQCPVNVLGLDVHKQLALRVNMPCRVTWALEKFIFSLLLTDSSNHTNKRRLVDSPVFGDVCSAVLKIVGSSLGSGPERGGTPSKRRVYWGREGTTNTTDHAAHWLQRYAD